MTYGYFKKTVRKKTWLKRRIAFYGRKSKTKALSLKITNVFCLRKKKIVLRACFCWMLFPTPGLRAWFHISKF